MKNHNLLKGKTKLPRLNLKYAWVMIVTSLPVSNEARLATSWDSDWKSGWRFRFSMNSTWIRSLIETKEYNPIYLFSIPATWKGLESILNFRSSSRWEGRSGAAVKREVLLNLNSLSLKAYIVKVFFCWRDNSGWSSFGGPSVRLHMKPNALSATTPLTKVPDRFFSGSMRGLIEASSSWGKFRWEGWEKCFGWWFLWEMLNQSND
jgi:hypothetical protein